MTQQHPITPPPHLIEQWMQDHSTKYALSRQAAQWGADQELEACCEWLQDPDLNVDTYKLRAARRPKPPSLKEQALALLDPSTTYGSVIREDEYRISATKAEIIRRALEQLDD
jgi:hypothetical protein